MAKNNEIIMKVAAMISEGKGDELEKALAMVEGAIDSQEEDCDCNCCGSCNCCSCEEDYEDDSYDEDDYEEDEYDEPIERHDITNALNSVAQMIAIVPNGIPVLPMPTVYGTGILVKLGDYGYSHTRLESVVGDDYDVIPVEIVNIEYEQSGNNEAFVSYETLYDQVIDYAFIIPHQELTISPFKWYLPMRSGGYASVGGVATDPVDMMNAVKTLYSTIPEDDMIHTPELGVKIVRNDGNKGKFYELGVYYHTDEPIELHKNGFHFAKEEDTLHGWYNHDYHEDKIFMVQSGPTIQEKHGIIVSDGIILTEEYHWQK